MPSNELKLDFMWSLHDKSCDKVHIPQFQQSRKLAIQIGQISSVAGQLAQLHVALYCFETVNIRWCDLSALCSSVEHRAYVTCRSPSPAYYLLRKIMRKPQIQAKQCHLPHPCYK